MQVLQTSQRIFRTKMASNFEITPEDNAAANTAPALENAAANTAQRPIRRLYYRQLHGPAKEPASPR